MNYHDTFFPRGLSFAIRNNYAVCLPQLSHTRTKILQNITNLLLNDRCSLCLVPRGERYGVSHTPRGETPRHLGTTMSNQ